MEILIAVGILGGLGLIFGLVLAAASKVFYVETDPRLDRLNECLPGANCGGCGYAGCSAYAEAVLKGSGGQMRLRRQRSRAGHGSDYGHQGRNGHPAGSAGTLLR